jgi:hypothetical protein
VTALFFLLYRAKTFDQSAFRRISHHSVLHFLPSFAARQIELAIKVADLQISRYKDSYAEAQADGSSSRQE